jgi:hypothetical protein
MVMLDSHYLALTSGMNDTTHIETRPRDTQHANFIYGPHHVCHVFLNSFQQSYGGHCKYYDGIDTLLEESYMSTLLVNNNATKFHMLGRDLIDSILPIIDISLLQFLLLTFDEHVVAGLELLERLHWHYAFT